MSLGVMPKKSKNYLNLEKWLPKSILCLLAGYTRRDLLSDLIAGVTVGLVARSQLAVEALDDLS